MPTQAELAAADEQHRQQQAENVAAMLLALNEAWKAVEPSNLVATGTIWLTEALSLLSTRRDRAVMLGQSYVKQVRELHFGADPSFVPPAPLVFNAVKVRKSLAYLGLASTAYDLGRIPGRRENQLRIDTGAPERIRDVEDENARILRENLSIDQMTDQAMKRAQQRVSEAAVRHTYDGGRDAVDAVVKKDARCLGFMRIERAKCCGWCGMLVSRGPVYREDSFNESDARFTGPGDHKVHDDCGGQLRPVYSRDEAEWTDTAREASALWADLGNVRGKAAVAEFTRRWRLRNASMQ